MKKIANFVYELYQLKSTKRAGWNRAFVHNPESIADHVLIASQIAFVLAELEGADSGKVLQMMVFHENGEARIGDIDRLQSRYFQDKYEREDDAVSEQMGLLPDTIAQKILLGFREFEDDASLEAKICKDADCLECAIQARLYMSAGNQLLQSWIDNASKSFRTKSAKKLFDEMMQTDPIQWVVDLKKIPPRK